MLIIDTYYVFPEVTFLSVICSFLHITFVFLPLRFFLSFLLQSLLFFYDIVFTSYGNIFLL